MRTTTLLATVLVLSASPATASSLREALDIHLLPRTLSVGISLHGAPGYSSVTDRTLAFGGGLALSSYRGEELRLAGCAPRSEESTLDRLARYKRRFVDRAPDVCDERRMRHGALAWRFSVEYEAQSTQVWSHALRLSFLRGLGGSDLAVGAGIGAIGGDGSAGLTAQLEAQFDLRRVWSLAWPRLAAFTTVRLDRWPETGVAGVVGLRLTLDTPRG